MLLCLLEGRGTSNLISDIAPNWNGHKDHLGIQPSPKHSTKFR